MKHCYHCGRFTPGKAPLFCQNCGRSYDVRLCPRLHANPRHAKVCSQCGATELSEVQPKVPFWWKALEFLTRVSIGVLLVCLSLGFLITMFQSPEGQTALLVGGILLGLLWWLWSELPDWFRKLVRRSLGKKEDEHERRR